MSQRFCIGLNACRQGPTWISLEVQVALALSFVKSHALTNVNAATP